MASPQKENGYTPIANEIMDALAKTRIPSQARQVLDVIIRMTWGFNCKESEIRTQYFISKTGLKRNRFHEAKAILVSMNVIYVKNHSYSINKDYEKWICPNNRTDEKVRITGQNCPDNRTKTVRITGQAIILKTTLKTTERQQESVATPPTPQALLVDNFSKAYQKATGRPFNTKRVYYKIAHDLITAHGLDECVLKIGDLASMCAEGARWPAKNGWADFTIENMLRNWNSIIYQKKLTEQEIKDKEFIELMEKRRKERAENACAITGN